MKTHLFKSLPAFFLAGVFGLSCGIASAEDVEEVLVYGKLLGQGEARANVQISSSVIEELPPGTGAAQLLQRVSGIQVGSSDALGGGGFDSTINMRGFGKDSIGFSIDGIPNGRTTLGGGSVPNRFLETSNLAGIDVSQSAGVIGSPSRQALVGHVNYLTDDPDSERGTEFDFSKGSFEYERYFLRHDTGEIFDGTTAYISGSFQDTDVWIGEGTGINERLHFDATLVKEFNNGAVVKLRNSYNDRDASGYNIVSHLQTPCAADPNLCFFDAFAPTNPAFTLDPNKDGYTDDWTGNALVDRLNRTTRGNERQDNLTYLIADLPVTDQIAVSVKPYFHYQDGTGRFMNASDEGAVPTPISTNAVDRELYFRKNNFDMKRYGSIFQVDGDHSELLNWTAGVWYEDFNRTQSRTWHRLINEAAGPDFVGNPFHVSEDKEWDNQVVTFYVSNESVLFDDRLALEYGLSFMDSQIDYTAPIHDSDNGDVNFASEVSVDSGILPKIGATFTMTDALEVFAGYSENAATVSDATLEAIAVAQGDPQTSTIDEMDSSEVVDFGLRYTSDNFGFGLQAFFIESTEIAAVDGANTLASSNLGSGKEIEGIEATFNGGYGPFELYVSATKQSHEYVLDGADADGYLASGFVRDGQDLVGIPDENAFVEFSWKPTDNFSFAINMNYVSERAGFYGNPNASSGLDSSFNFITGAAAQSSDERIPSYTVFGLNASYETSFNDNFIKGVKASFNVENLTDENYLSGVAPELLGADRKWVGRYFLGAPRTVFFTVNTEF